MSKIDEETFSEALYNTGVLLPVSTSSKGSKVEATCRTAPDKSKEWPVVAENLLRAAADMGVTMHVCKQYLLKDGEMVYASYVSMEATSVKQLRSALSELADKMESGRPPKAKPAVNADPVVKPLSYKEYKKQTTATPRAPMPGELKNIPVPPGFQYQSKRVSTGVGANGTQIVIDEVPIPNVFHEMNVPNAKGRGAKYTG